MLQFVVWFQDYRRRFLALPAAVQAASPGRSHFSFALPNPARTAERVRLSKARADAVQYTGGDSLWGSAPSSPASSYKRVQLAPVDTALARCDSIPSPRSLSTPNSPLSSQPSTSYPPDLVQPCDQPFRDECTRIVATFLRPDAAKELPLDPAVRDTVIRDLTWNTHPDVFLPVYEELFHTLEAVSLPRFLAAASANINRPTQLLWYALGAFGIALGVFLAVLLVCVVHVPPQANRAWRLLAVVPTVVGMMQIYGGYRGFCGQVWRRGASQLHEWELEEMDEQTGAHWDSLLTRAPSPPPSAAHADDAKVDARWSERRGDTGERAASFTIAPFTSPQLRPGSERKPTSGGHSRAPRTCPLSLLRPPKRAFSLRSRSHSTASTLSSDPEKQRVAAYPGRRAPFFGPEKVVLDPRIRALHRAVVREVVCFGVVAMLVLAAILLAVPDRGR
ncbi:uncharacterized protein B0H18DRAFT_292693 [Fomitopsis serialis]|uniref:uncharacterized protein n=1 Tax=Fomitopsis serialis TaxID=139415 RepID=UPI002007EA5E|nr:uncharacterized protein B0H18DRAFT_292693 [Neoantrodia serialis]KAH9927283.1 hypothetical protein B0H18DRAFT_292693 [Neoantrodia serialis]